MGLVFRRFIATLFVIVFLLFFCSTASLHGFSGGFGQGRNEIAGSGLSGQIIDKKRLLGPGSVPPKCRLKCGKCEPCKAVHVPIKPGLIMPLEYYPEAWRCKCGNKIFMPRNQKI